MPGSPISGALLAAKAVGSPAAGSRVRPAAGTTPVLDYVGNDSCCPAMLTRHGAMRRTSRVLKIHPRGNAAAQASRSASHPGSRETRPSSTEH